MKYIIMAAWLIFSSPTYAEEATLPMPTLELRKQAVQEYGQGNTVAMQDALAKAEELAKEQEVPYVQVNELRYIAEVWVYAKTPSQASRILNDAMNVAVTIPEWNYRLYGCIGILELQHKIGDMKGVHNNGLKAIENGLLEKVAESGGAAEIARFFIAMDGALTRMEREKLRAQVRLIDQPDLQAKALHALDGLTVKEF